MIRLVEWEPLASVAITIFPNADCARRPLPQLRCLLVSAPGGRQGLPDTGLRKPLGPGSGTPPGTRYHRTDPRAP
jgi:hypothetical protein